MYYTVVSKKLDRISVFMFAFETFSKPLEKLAHTFAFTMSFPVAYIYKAYKTKQAPHTQTFSIFHPPFNVQHFNFKP